MGCTKRQQNCFFYPISIGNEPFWLNLYIFILYRPLKLQSVKLAIWLMDWMELHCENVLFSADPICKINAKSLCNQKFCFQI